ncbi:MAG: septal ring lytic transglycosylase RlpA family protein [Mariprofundales bacterium]|nr:septal ring lytic transglycosylase RlpA family protein [Mariprofundales bacterium]
MRCVGVLMLIALLLSGCGKQGVAVWGSGGGGYTPPPVAAGGHHKTGKPYQIGGQWYYPLQSAAGYDETGVASWYGRDFHGKKTANGEIYNMHAMSAAHKTLPLPTMVRVTNLDNGRSVVVRVNDRGPFVKSRIIDLSYAAAQALGYDRRGTARVRVQALSGAVAASSPRRPARVGSAINRAAPSSGNLPRGTLPNNAVFVQVGAFSSYANAQSMRRQLAGFSPVIIQRSGAIYRVRIGPLVSMQRVEKMVLDLQGAGFNQAIVVIE